MNDVPIIPRGYTEEKIKSNAFQYAQMQVYARHNAKPEVQAVNLEFQETQQEWNRLLGGTRDEDWESKFNAVKAKMQELQSEQQKNQLQFTEEVNRETEELTRREILEYRASRADSGGGCDAIEELRELIEELQGRIDELEGQLEEAQSAAEEAQSEAEEAQSAVDKLESRVDNLEE